jgi:hypothetical protein
MTRLTRPAAAKFLGENGLPMAPTTLAKKAVEGSGPPYQLWNGQAIYETQDLLAWATSRLGPKLRSTADRKPALSGRTPDPSTEEDSTASSRNAARARAKPPES